MRVGFCKGRSERKRKVTSECYILRREWDAVEAQRCSNDCKKYQMSKQKYQHWRKLFFFMSEKCVKRLLASVQIPVKY